MEQEPKAGIYKHFKGDLYFVSGVAQNTENSGEKFVVYYPLYKSETPMWVRPLSSWNEPVDKPEYKGERFAFVRGDFNHDLLIGTTHRMYDEEQNETQFVSGNINGYTLKGNEVFVDYTKTYLSFVTSSEECSEKYGDFLLELRD
jgi:hypothetical protein